VSSGLRAGEEARRRRSDGQPSVGRSGSLGPGRAATRPTPGVAPMGDLPPMV
jgi:hypothetical protein